MEKTGLGICQKVNVLQYQNSILQQSPCVVVVGTGSSINVSISSNLSKANNTDKVIYIKQDIYIIIVPHNTIVQTV